MRNTIAEWKTSTWASSRILKFCPAGFNKSLTTWNEENPKDVKVEKEVKEVMALAQVNNESKTKQQIAEYRISKKREPEKILTSL